MKGHVGILTSWTLLHYYKNGDNVRWNENGNLWRIERYL